MNRIPAFCVLGVLATLCLGTVSASQKERVRIIQEDCTIDTIVQNGKRILAIVCEEVCFASSYELTDPGPTVQTGVDGSGNRYIDVVAPPDRGFDLDGDLECFEDQVWALVDPDGPGGYDSYFDCVPTTVDSICIELSMSTGSGSGIITFGQGGCP